MQLVILAGVFVGTLLLIVGIYTFVNRRRLEAMDVMRSRLEPTYAVPEARVSILKDSRFSTLEALDRLLAGRSFSERIRVLLERAGSRQSVGEFVLVSVLLAGVGLVFGSRLAPVIGILAGTLAGGIPLARVLRMRAQRVKALEAQLPDAIDMLVNALRAGYSMQAAMKFVGDEMPAPIGPEFARYYEEQRLGMDPRLALLALQDRGGTLDLKMLVTALLIQRETGGNLAEILTNISTIMRDRVAIRGKIATLTAEPRMTGIILVGVPVFLFIFLTASNREFMRPMFETPIGRLLLVYSVVSLIVGYFAMQKVAEIDV